MDCYDQVVHLVECLIPAVCNEKFFKTHAARCGVMIKYQANRNGAHRAIPQRKSSYRGSP